MKWEGPSDHDGRFSSEAEERRSTLKRSHLRRMSSLMDRNQLEHLVLRGRWQHHGTYCGKRLCQACLMEKAPISTLDDHLRFEHIWHRWVYRLKRDRCVVHGELKETMMLPAN